MNVNHRRYWKDSTAQIRMAQTQKDSASAGKAFSEVPGQSRQNAPRLDPRQGAKDKPVNEVQPF